MYTTSDCLVVCRHVYGTEEERAERVAALQAGVSGPVAGEQVHGTTKMEDVDALIRGLGACREGTQRYTQAKNDLIQALCTMDVSQLDNVVQEVKRRRGGQA